MPDQPTIVLLAAGKNSRFFPLNTTTHKAGITLLGKPLIIRTLENLEQHGFKKVVVVVGSKDGQGAGLSQALSNTNLSLDLQLVIQQEPKGMGDALLQACQHLQGPFVVAHPYYHDIGQTIKQMMSEGEQVICVSKTETPWEFGMVNVQNNKAVGIVEKPAQGKEPSDLKNVVLHLLTPTFLEILEKTPTSEYSYETALNQLMSESSVLTHHLIPGPPSLKYAWELLPMQQTLLEQQTAQISAEANVASTAVIDQSQGPVVVEAGATISHAARVVGPAYIGKNAVVGDFSLIRQSSIESDSTVGAYTEVTRSIILPNSSVHFGYLADSIIGQNVRVGAGILASNKRYDRQEVTTHIKGQKVSTGTNRLGTIIGDQAAIGVRLTTMPGVLIGAQATVYPGLVLFENVDHNQTLKK